MAPKWFGTIQMILFEYRSFWTGRILFRQVQIVKISPEKSNLKLSKIIWTQSKQFTPIKNNLDGPKSFRTYRRTGHKSFGLICDLKTLAFSKISSLIMVWLWLARLLLLIPLIIDLDQAILPSILSNLTDPAVSSSVWNC